MSTTNENIFRGSRTAIGIDVVGQWIENSEQILYQYKISSNEAPNEVD